MRGKSKRTQADDAVTQPGPGATSAAADDQPPAQSVDSGSAAAGSPASGAGAGETGSPTSAAGEPGARPAGSGAGEVIDAEVVEPATTEAGTAPAEPAGTTGTGTAAAGTAGAGTVEGEPVEGEPVEGEVIDVEVIDVEPAAPGAVPDNAIGAELGALRSDLDEMTRDLQRVSAEYANYRRRVERDRNLVAEQAVGTVLSSLLPVLDDLDRARDHGDLVGPFGSVAEQLVATVSKFGLSSFGEKGDPFDPTRHEAVAHQTSGEVTESTCVEIMRRGYMLGDRLLRPALVAVADPQ